MTQVLCANCGSNWESNVVLKVCTECNSTDIVVSYERINQKQYDYLQNNIDNDKKFNWVCPECKATKELFSDDLYNVHCPNGCDSLMIPKSQLIDQGTIIETMKSYRKKRRWNQSLMAIHLNVSRGYYAQLETGKKPVPQQLIPKILALK